MASDQVSIPAGQAIHDARWRFNIALGLTVCGHWLVRWMCVAGGVILALKATGYHHFCSPLWVLVSAVPLSLLVGWYVHGNRYSDADAAVWLDWKNRLGGGLIGVADGAVPTETLPIARAVGISPLPFLKQIAVPLLFLLASLWVRGAAWEPEISVAHLRHRVRRVRQNIETAERAGVLPPQAAVALDEQAARALGEGERSAEAAAEAIDQVQQTLERNIVEQAAAMQKGMQAADKLMQADLQTEDLKEMEALAETFSQALDALPNEKRLSPKLRRTLQQMMKQMNCNSKKQMGSQSAACLSKMDPKDLQKLAQMMSDEQLQNLQSCSGLQGMMSDKQLRELLQSLTKGQKCSGGLSEEALAKLGLSSSCKSGRPGRGGITRGRGDAELSFGDEASAAGVRFTPKTIKSKNRSIPGVTIGKTRMGAQKIPPAEFRLSGRSGVDVGKTGGGEMSGAPLGPYHRDVTARYFSEEKK